MPGGHREGDETSEDCVRREADKEAAIELGDLKLIWRWKIEKTVSFGIQREISRPSVSASLRR